MGIHRDVYRFDPHEFRLRLWPLLQRMEERPKEGYHDLRESALVLLQEVNHVQTFAEDYGGWTLDAIRSQMQEYAPYSAEDVAFWATLHLYGHLTPLQQVSQTLNAPRWEETKVALLALGFDGEFMSLLEYGRPFEHLLHVGEGVNSSDQPSRRLLDVLGAIRPSSTGGHAGWLDRSDLHEARREMEERCAHMLSNLPSPQADALSRLARLLGESKDDRAGWCVIISG